MTDRELLELAAKAMGCGIKESRFQPGQMVIQTHEHEWTLWNPLNEDGCGARMEATLGIDIEWLCGAVAANVDPHEPGISVLERYDAHGGDKQAARRLASLRAAAEIGRAMQ